ncbi:low molecular weight protein-tyrosine-phosphatase [Aliikangiella sp. IMCC44359]|uniref:low molecular weight protein-tyrosine-phosphatase n=1 Tax=Aliikangiella sp. IMCC44359 TaxID=3459125 RepID=UPI00403A8CFF
MSYSILFVCLGNICRSPTAEGVFRKLATEKLGHLKLNIDSAGTAAHHVGENADPRTIQAASNRGYDLSNIISRQVVDEDFETYDMILAMDKSNFNYLINQAKSSKNDQHINKIKLFLKEFASNSVYSEVPDPYYGGDKGFDLVIDLIEDASSGLIEGLNKSI